MKARDFAHGDGVQDIQKIVEQHPGEWLAIAVAAEKGGQPTAGQLVCHARDPDEVWRRTRNWKRLYVVYAGPPLKKGYAAAF